MLSPISLTAKNRQAVAGSRDCHYNFLLIHLINLVGKIRNPFVYIYLLCSLLSIVYTILISILLIRFNIIIIVKVITIIIINNVNGNDVR